MTERSTRRTSLRRNLPVASSTYARDTARPGRQGVRSKIFATQKGIGSPTAGMDHDRQNSQSAQRGRFSPEMEDDGTVMALTFAEFSTELLRRLTTRSVVVDDDGILSFPRAGDYWLV
jgi:hypothetical protein